MHIIAGNYLIHIRIPRFRSVIYDLYLFSYLFLLVYAPRLIQINTLHILFVTAVIGATFTSHDFIYVLSRKNISSFIVINILLCMFCMLVAYINVNSAKDQIYRFFAFGLEMPICVCYCLASCRKHGYSVDKLMRIVIAICVVQSFSVFLMLVSPTVKSAVNQHFFRFWSDKQIAWSAKRLYGIADNMFHTTPLVQAIFAAVILWESQNKKALLIMFPFVILSVVVNARTPIFILLVSLVLFFTRKKHAIKAEYIKGFVMILFLLLCCLWIFQGYRELSTESYSYLLKGMTEITDFFLLGVKGKIYNDFTGRFIIFPSGPDLMFGVGGQLGGIISAKYQVYSDIGFINDIWQGGLIMMFAWIYVFLKNISLIGRSNYSGAGYLRVVMLAGFFIGHLKGIITFYNDYSVIWLLFSTMYVLNVNTLDKDTTK